MRTVSFEADGDPAFQANCHCKDYRQITGSPFATLVSMQQSDVKESGQVNSFDHAADSGTVLTKEFCPKCGSQMFGKSGARELHNP